MLATIHVERVAWSDSRLRGGFAAVALAGFAALALMPRVLVNGDEHSDAGQPSRS